jgi:hypothetical protein
MHKRRNLKFLALQPAVNGNAVSLMFKLIDHLFISSTFRFCTSELYQVTVFYGVPAVSENSSIVTMLSTSWFEINKTVAINT